MNSKTLFLLIILALGIFLRIYRLNDIPPGLNPDEASIGYNAYSLLETGQDRYGQTLPLAFRSLGTYLLPMYTYLTIVPVAIFGPTIFSVHFISALSSILVVFLTALIAFEIKKITFLNKLLIVLLISISPWAVYFGRGAHEISLSLALFILSIFLFIKSISNPKLISITLLVAGLSGYAYYTERYLSLIFFPLLVWIFKDKFIRHKKYLLIGVFLLIISQLPQLTLIQSEAFARRIEQVNYWNDKAFNGNGGGKLLYVLREFSSHYLEYFSPRSLFFDPDPQQARSTPDLSVFYVWMIVPLWFGIKFLLKNERNLLSYGNKSDPIFKILLSLLVIAPLPAALTRDPFYSLRILSLLWVLTIIVSFGSSYLLELIPKKPIRIILIVVVTTISLTSLYNSYFVLLKYEREGNFGYQYRELADKLREYPDIKIVVDSSRIAAAHIWIPFYGKLGPNRYQSQVSSEIKNNYYNNTDLDTETKIDNLEIRPIFWEKDIYEDKVLVGDQLAISDEQIKEHKLTPLFQIKGMDGKIRLLAYITNPKEKCEVSFKKGLLNPKCEVFLPF